MTGTVCSVASCRSNREQSVKEGETISFFTFPKDPHTRKEWIRRCFRTDKFNPNHKRICSKHFELNQFEDLVKANLFNTQPKKLKKAAVPTLFLPYNPEECLDERSERLEIRERKDVKAPLLSSPDDLQHNKTNILDNSTHLPSMSEQSAYQILSEKFSTLQSENETLKCNMLNMEQELKLLREINEKMQDSVINTRKSLENRIEEVLRDFLPADQLDIVIEKILSPAPDGQMMISSELVVIKSENIPES